MPPIAIVAPKILSLVIRHFLRRTERGDSVLMTVSVTSIAHNKELNWIPMIARLEKNWNRSNALTSLIKKSPLDECRQRGFLPRVAQLLAGWIYLFA